MFKVIIADDVQDIRESLEKMLGAYCPDAQVVASTESVASAVAAIKMHSPDVVLLDVEMKDGTGFDVLKQFPSARFKVIFVTAYQQYSLEAFRFSALDYLLKPVDPELLIQAVNKAADVIDREKLVLKIDSFLHNMQETSKGPKKIVLRTIDNIYVVTVNEIVYCEADQSYTTFHLQDKSRIVVTRSLSEFDEMLTPYLFVRIHQSYLVNITFIKRFNKTDNTLLLSDGAALPVSVRKKDQLLQLLASL
jgi:two-component system LytT family response regulator